MTEEANDIECVQTIGDVTTHLERVEARLAKALGITENVRVEIVTRIKRQELVEDELVADWHDAYASYKSMVKMLVDEVKETEDEAGRLACSACNGEGKVLGDCGDSPNVWFDPCPDCQRRDK